MYVLGPGSFSYYFSLGARLIVISVFFLILFLNYFYTNIQNTIGYTWTDCIVNNSDVINDEALIKDNDGTVSYSMISCIVAKVNVKNTTGVKFYRNYDDKLRTIEKKADCSFLPDSLWHNQKYSTNQLLKTNIFPTRENKFKCYVLYDGSKVIDAIAYIPDRLGYRIGLFVLIFGITMGLLMIFYDIISNLHYFDAKSAYSEFTNDVHLNNYQNTEMEQLLQTFREKQDDYETDERKNQKKNTTPNNSPVESNIDIKSLNISNFSNLPLTDIRRFSSASYPNNQHFGMSIQMPTVNIAAISPKNHKDSFTDDDLDHIEEIQQQQKAQNKGKESGKSPSIPAILPILTFSGQGYRKNSTYSTT